ncbi:DNA ligase D [Polymorphobacter fuscus]|uniref:DNA ligase (ATP) n=1 Tax=Sandarakinorhabdus fusca TaxID=1439888 RepID=A0A7C9GR35_9SPHN|nr:DNA ligase D [Polymorphobacter fuscus]KAB7644869.1 DNA ligase D [Polymorphobacter fuscus]MQT18150.1 DNA ligase D [Polymorphobacter fuscus]NJC09468.1 bifunctional non-homologous end joining protein LigD [Polymorphobacter fuscus]
MTADPLATYNAKRDFALTTEPAGKRGKVKSKARAFVVQKHGATRLHWDFRLELDGVLLSWAVTRGPSTSTKDRRLAVRTEDHPLDYGSFEGTIPKGQYGGGTVMLWDRGTWEPIDEPREGVKNGKFHFILHGERMHGEWVLIRLKPDEGKKAGRENWLLFKIADDHANGADLVATHDVSVSTGRSMDDIAKGAKVSPKTKKQGTMPPPAFRAPQLATLVDTPPTGNDWLHETKYDGYRALLAVGGGKALAYTRSGLDWTEKFASVAAAAAALPCASALVDAEICALDGDGRPSFGLLQAALKDGGPIVAFGFDLLEHDGIDLTKAPLTERKAALATLLADAPSPLFYAEHVRGGGERMFAALCGAGYEGVVSKRADAPYRGGRTKVWLKSKCTHRQEFVIGGWAASEKGRGFASLLLGVHETDGLRYAGHVGTGFDDRTLAMLTERLAGLAADTTPFAGKLSAEARRRAHWVKPELVAEVAFAEFTSDGIVRHASFIGLREDKPAKTVIAEKPAGKAVSGASALATLGVTISSPDRIVFPDLGLSKQALAEYYALLGDAMLTDMAGRPISLVRCPQGRGKACFFQKHDSGMFPDSVRHVPIAETDGKQEDYLYLEDTAGVVACVQMGTIEFHGWGSRVADLERPDRLVFDLDPDEGLGFDAVKAAALLVRDRLKAVGLASLPMVTGGKGVHVVAPLVPDADWPVVKAWARSFAEALATERPADFTATMSKAKRKGRIFIDWLRNQRGATAVMPFSVRARDGAGVAVPLTWAELAEATSGNGFTAADPAAVLAMAKRRKTVRASKLPK